MELTMNRLHRSCWSLTQWDKHRRNELITTGFVRNRQYYEPSGLVLRIFCDCPCRHAGRYLVSRLRRKGLARAGTLSDSMSDVHVLQDRQADP